MKLGVFSLAFSIVIATVLIEESNSYFLHTQNVFCDPAVDFVIRGKVKKITNAAAEIVYKVKIQKKYKGSAAFNALPNTNPGDINFFRSLTPGGTPNGCTAILMKKRYVLTGRVVGGQLYISQCTDWIQLWSDLYPIEKQNLKNNYIPNCGCSVQQITGVQPPFPPPPTACLIINKACGRYTYCQCSDPGCTSCGLAPSNDYQVCFNNSPLPP